MDLGVGDFSVAVAINDRGHIVGNRAGLSPFLWRNGTVTDILPPGVNGRVTDINIFDEVVGYRTVDGNDRAFLWKRGVLTDLGVLPGGTRSFANAISDRGEIVGTSDAGGRPGLHPVRWRAGVMTELGALPGESLAQANDVNLAGTVTGDSGSFNQVAVRWDRAGVIERLTNVPSVGKAINDLGAVTGLVLGGTTHGFFWEDGQFTEIHAPSGTFFLQPFGINNTDQVVGGTSEFAFLWQNGELTELPKLEVWATARDINNAGQIVGRSPVNPNGTNEHAVLWTTE